MTAENRGVGVDGRVALLASDLARHALVVGKTGMGKSRLLSALCREQAVEGQGFLLVDPHGDLAEDVRSTLPRKRRNDLVQFFAADGACPGLNPLKCRSPQDRYLAVSNVLDVCRKLWPDFWGPRTEHVLRHVLLALSEVRSATLEDARLMLIDDARRRWVLRQASDPSVGTFWGKEFPTFDRRLWAEIAAPILNKLGNLLAAPAVHAVLTRRRPVLDPERAMDQGRIVVASLPKGGIGTDGALFLGALLLGEFTRATFARSRIPETERRPFMVVADEAASFASGPFLELVAEARKYGVALVLATQSLSAIDAEVRAAFLGNVGTLAAFRLGADDAEIVSREFVHEYAAAHLMRLPVGDAVIRAGAKRARLVSGPDA